MMDPFSPRPNEPGQRYEQPSKGGSGPLWLLAIMVGVVGVLAVVSAI
jgi:hypothetical protein